MDLIRVLARIPRLVAEAVLGFRLVAVPVPVRRYPMISGFDPRLYGDVLDRATGRGAQTSKCILIRL